MAQEFAKKFYNSSVWKKTRAAYLKSVHYLCERCLVEGRCEPANIVHHKIHLTPTNINNPSITLDFKNLEAVCKSCHDDTHNPSATTQKDVTFDENGNLIKKEP